MHRSTEENKDQLLEDWSGTQKSRNITGRKNRLPQMKLHHFLLEYLELQLELELEKLQEDLELKNLELK